MKDHENCFWYNDGTCEFFEGLEDLCKECVPCAGPENCGDCYKPIEEDEDDE